MTVFPKTITGNLVSAAAAAVAVVLFAAWRLPDWAGVAAIVFLAANILVAAVRAMSWCLGEYPKRKEPEDVACFKFVIRLERIDERR